MILPSPKDAIHKAWLYRLLAALYDNQLLADVLYFKGGTCAAMLGWLDRFSVDLDFDYLGEKKDLAKIRKEMEKIFANLELEIKDKSQKVPQYFLKYGAPAGARNTLKVDTTLPPPKSNIYQPLRLTEIDRMVRCQTKETMLANKLVALIERHEQHESIAGRDIYDIHYFFLQGTRYNKAVIKERRRKSCLKFFGELINFVEKKITMTVLTQDLSTLLEPKKFQDIRKILKQETLMLLKDELRRLKSDN